MMITPAIQKVSLNYQNYFDNYALNPCADELTCTSKLAALAITFFATCATAGLFLMGIVIYNSYNIATRTALATTAGNLATRTSSVSHSDNFTIRQGMTQGEFKTECLAFVKELLEENKSRGDLGKRFTMNLRRNGDGEIVQLYLFFTKEITLGVARSVFQDIEQDILRTEGFKISFVNTDRQHRMRSDRAFYKVVLRTHSITI
ncbi:MAG: hypothetical protein HY860_04550 [Chlamydiales bacterium]|nr:hypothetical protein [Chlamydiales bacterium]